MKERVRKYNQLPERKAYEKKYNQQPEVKERNNKRKRDSYKNNPELREKKRLYHIEHNKIPEVRERRNYKKRLRMQEPKNKLSNSISCAVRRCLNGTKESPTFDILDFTLVELQSHIEKQFIPGMTWDNYGEWQIDHKIPIHVHNFKKAEDEDFKKCWALENLQPLWATDNASKGAKLKKPFQQSIIFGE